MGIQDVYQKMNLQEKVKEINAYILTKIGKDGLESNKKSYEDILSSLNAEIGIKENLEFTTKIDKLATYARLLTEQNRIERLKTELKNG